MWLLVPFQKTKNNFWSNDVIRQVTWHVLKGLNTDQNRIQIDFTWNWPTALKSCTPLYNRCFKITIITRVEALLTDTCKWKAPLIILQPPSESPVSTPIQTLYFHIPEAAKDTFRVNVVQDRCHSYKVTLEIKSHLPVNVVLFLIWLSQWIYISFRVCFSHIHVWLHFKFDACPWITMLSEQQYSQTLTKKN